MIADTVRLAADAGLVGCTIEDTTGNLSDEPLHDSSVAVERIATAAQRGRAFGFPFHSDCASAQPHVRQPEAWMTQSKRLQAFERGADVLFAPELPDLNAARAICTALPKPVNFMVWHQTQILIGR